MADKILLDRIPGLRVVDLKDCLRARNLPAAGVKAELAERLRSYLLKQIEEAEAAELAEEAAAKRAAAASSATATEVASKAEVAEPVPEPAVEPSMPKAAEEEVTLTKPEPPESPPKDKELPTALQKAPCNEEPPSLEEEPQPVAHAETVKDKGMVSKSVDLKKDDDVMKESADDTSSEASDSNDKGDESEVLSDDSSDSSEPEAATTEEVKDVKSKNSQSVLKEDQVQDSDNDAITINVEGDIDMLTEDKTSEKRDEKATKEEEISAVAPSVPFKSLKTLKFAHNKTTADDQPGRKRKWARQTSINISSNVLKDLVPENAVEVSSPKEDEVIEVKSASEVELEVEPKIKDDIITESPEPQSPPEKKDKPSPKEEMKGKENIAETNVVKNVAISEDKPESEKPTGPPKVIATTRRLPTLLTDGPKDSKRAPSPAQNPVSAIIHVRGLVRPFTLKQLKEVLGQHGTLVEEGFWIDNIKSHCYATYSAEDEATSAREALHGAKWPLSNPRVLRVDFATQKDIAFVRGELPEPVKETPSRNVERDKKKEDTTGDKSREKPRRSPERSAERSANRDRDRARENRPREAPIREWDIGKTNKSPGRSRSRSPRRNRRSPMRRRSRSRSPGSGKRRRGDSAHMNGEKEKKVEPPAKLLDDLFRKTTTQPCIYWLPLTEEQATLRDDERRKRRAERQKEREIEDGPPVGGRRASVSPPRRRR